MEPNSATARYFLGLAYADDRKLDQAESAWTEAVRLDNSFAPAYVELAKMKLQSGDAAAAVHYAENAARANSRMPDALLVLGNAYLARKDSQNAIATFEKLVAMLPDNPLALERLGFAYGRRRPISQRPSLSWTLQSVIDLKSGLALTTLTRLYLQQHQADKAIQKINQQVAQYPNNPVLYEILGQAYYDQKNYAKAEESYRKSLALDSNRMDAYNLLGQVYLMQNSLDKAIQQFAGAVKIDPKSVTIHTMLGILNEARSAKDKAESQYREALKLDPAGYGCKQQSGMAACRVRCQFG